MKINSYRKLTDLKWLNMFEVAYADKNGRNRRWQVASRAKEPKCITEKYEKPDAVVIVPFHPIENKIASNRTLMN